jgi:FkbM family methyltransferase
MNLEHLELLNAYVQMDGWTRGAASFLRAMASLRRRVESTCIRLPGTDIEVRFRPRTSDYATLRACWFEGAYDVPFSRSFDAEATFGKLIERGRPLVVDLGAHIGLASLRLVNRYPGVQLVAVEPAPRNVTLLRHNLAVVPDAIVLPGAIWRFDGDIGLSSPENDFSQDCYVTSEIVGDRRVRALALDSVLATAPEAIPFFLKVDIEGAEAQLFREDVPWKFPIIAIESHEWLHPGEHTLSGFLEGHMARSRDLLVGTGGVLFSVE